MTATTVSAIETDDVIVLIFDPNAAQKPALARFWKRGHVEYQAPDFTQEFSAHVIELVVLRIEAAGIDEDHLQKAVGQVLHGEREEIADAGEDLLAFAVCVGKRNQTDGLGKIRFTQKIFITGGNFAEFLVRLQILNIGFNKRSVFLHLAIHVVLIAYHTIDNLFHGARFSRGSLRCVVGRRVGRRCGDQHCGAARCQK